MVGRTLTATANPISSTVTTVWYQPSFKVDSSASTTTDTGTSSGGCGFLGQHAIWVYNVQNVPTVVNFEVEVLRVSLLALTVALVLHLSKDKVAKRISRI